jgi:hypothetical protein
VLDLSRVHTKDYFCSYNPEKYIDGNPHINLYIQSTPICNGSCEFCGACDSRNINFNYSKLHPKELSSGKNWKNSSWKKKPSMAINM